MTAEGDPCTTPGCNGMFEIRQTWIARKHGRGPDVAVCTRCGLQVQLPKDERPAEMPKEQMRLI